MVGTKENFVRNPNPELLTDQLNNIWVSFAIDKKHVRTPTVASAPTDPSHMTQSYNKLSNICTIVNVNSIAFRGLHISYGCL